MEKIHATITDTTRYRNELAGFMFRRFSQEAINFNMRSGNRVTFSAQEQSDQTAVLEEGQRASNSCSVRTREDCLAASKMRLTTSSLAGMLWRESQ
jgi:hypothetical protein